MSDRKERLSVTLDRELVEAGHRAVAQGAAASVSAWVSAALVEHVRRAEKLEHLRAAIADYEGEFGEITDEEMRAQRRADREAAVVVRGRGSGRRRRVRTETRTP